MCSGYNAEAKEKISTANLHNYIPKSLFSEKSKKSKTCLKKCFLNFKFLFFFRLKNCKKIYI